MQLQTKLPEVGTTIFTVMSRLAAEHGAVNLGQGFPDFEPPESLREALARAMANGQNQYAPDSGMPALREQLALKTERLYGRRFDPGSEITITSGASEALFAAIASVVHAGDEVIVFDPAYDCYEPAIRLQGGKTVHVPLDAPGFHIDWQRARDALSKRTRMVIINSPHNPSGAILTADDLEQLAAMLRGTDVIVLLDEVYQHIVYDGARHQSVWLNDELAERSFAVGSFGKTWHCTGWKVGYCIAPEALSAEFRNVHQFMTFCTFRPAQVALAEALENNAEHYLGLSAFYQARRDRFRALLADSRLKLLDVEGGFFQLVDYGEVSDTDDIRFSEWLVHRGGVAGIPISPFYETAPDTRLLRLCFAKSDATLEAGAEYLRQL